MGTNDEIDKLFSSRFENYNIPASEDEWAKLHSDLKWVNFWKFQFYSFNIFYVIGIAGIIAVLSLMLFNNQPSVPQKKQTLDSIQNFLPEMKDSLIQINDSVPQNKTGYISEKKPKTEGPTKGTTVKLQSDSIVKVPVIHEQEVHPMPDTLKRTNELYQAEQKSPKVDTTAKQPRVRKVKRTTVVKTDAVIVRDTIDITKKKK